MTNKERASILYIFLFASCFDRNFDSLLVLFVCHVPFFSGPATKTLPLELSGHIFWGNFFGIFLDLQKKWFFLVARPLKKEIFLRLP